jgi:membrane carboxypeptidase/penicillin-binding protein PbpC
LDRQFRRQIESAFIGRTAVAPLLFQIIDALRTSWPEPNEPHRPPPNANLKRVEFCAVSGDLPGPHCRHKVEGWFIPGISPIKTCDVHQEVLVDAATGLRVPIDDVTRILRREVYWFAGKTFIGKSQAADILTWKSAPGTYRLVAGRSRRIGIVSRGRSLIATARVRY